MARPLRVEYPGAIYHLTGRGNARAPIFIDDEDRQMFLAILGAIVERSFWLCHGYCLMDNHYHLLVETTNANLSAGMRQLGGVYTQQFNRRHDRVGHLFQGRYKAIVVDKENYLLELCRYIVLNPVRANIVEHPGQYRWSSYNASAGTSLRPKFLSVDWILAQFGRKKNIARQRYVEFVLAGRHQESPWQKLKGQCLLGGEAFLDRLSPYLERKRTEKEIPRHERFAAQPPLAELFPASQTKYERDQAIALAYQRHGFSQQEIAKQCGLHYSTISRIVQREIENARGKT